MIDLHLIKQHYKVKIKFASSDVMTWQAGYVNPKTSTIYIDAKWKKDKRMLASILFHEIGHIHCYRNNIWQAYHNMNKLTKKDKRLIIVTGLKAEKWVDQWAAVELSKWYPEIPFHFTYFSEYQQKVYKEKYLSLYK